MLTAGNESPGVSQEDATTYAAHFIPVFFVDEPLSIVRLLSGRRGSYQEHQDKEMSSFMSMEVKIPVR